MPTRPTFAMLLNSRAPKAVGLCADDRTEVAAYANESQERLIMDPLAPDEGWWGGWATMLFNLTPSNHAAYLRTPAEVGRIIVTDICQRARPLRNGFYEYLQFGSGYKPQPCGSNCCAAQAIYERDNVPTLIPFPSSAPQYIRLYPSDSSDVGKQFVVQGPDQNGLPVLGVDPVTGGSNLGETINLALPFVTSSYQYQDITGLIKQATSGPVKIFTVDPTTGVEAELSSMEPNETTASYRQYLFNGLPTHCCNTSTGTVQIQTQCKLEPQPVFNDTDYLSILSIPALIEEMQALRYSRMDTEIAAKLEAKHHAKAIALLTGQLDFYEGKIQTAVRVSIFNGNKLQRQPV